MEDQNTEWKLTWRDEYLKWICGFANAHGGAIYLGCNDEGEIVGLANSRKLLEDIPNKVREVLGILVDVDLLHSDEGREYICIHVKPSLFPVNYKGEYHYRSGATKQQLQGGALTQFLLQRAGANFYWDAFPVPDVTMDDLDSESFKIFRKGAVRSGRMTEESAKADREDLLRGLGLIQDGRLTRAAVLLFHSTPEQWFPGAYAKIAYFPNDADIAYMDEVRGSLFLQAERIVELLYLKYMKSAITYEGINRVETPPFPRPAVREAVLNALVHSCYASGIPMQIRVYEDKLYISNSSFGMEGWTMERYVAQHRSEPFNPAIAGAFFRAGFIEAWGRGIEKICHACSDTSLPQPGFEGRATSFLVTFQRGAAPATNAPDTAVGLSRKEQQMRRIVELMRQNPAITTTQIAEEMELSRVAISNIISYMKAQGTVSRDEGKRFGRWIVIDGKPLQ